ncbi:MAG: drug/metabolite transporter (DMT)-like permease [Crocinitomicaceae bacterium]|jgi:drug/metabolite transporter (DMT)-like permease
MIALIFSVICSSLILVLFKLFDRYKIDTFQAIVFNYFMAFIIGFSLYGNQWNPQSMQQTGWMIYAAISAVLFIGLFFIMAKSSQINGVASTSVAVKMSMAISIILMIVGYSESFNILKVIGILFAILGVFLVSYSKGSKTNATWMLLLLFFGSGALDFTLNYVQNYELGSMSTALFSAIGLGMAGIIGFLILIAKFINGSSKFHIKNVIAGIFLGIPNFFSIYLLILSYSTTGWQDSTVLAITNVSVVLLSSMIGFIAFKENASKQKIIGLISAILAIGILYFSN